MVAGRGSGRWVLAAVVAGLPVVAVVGGLAGNKAAGLTHWPGWLDFFRRHPWPTILGTGVVSVLGGLLLWWKDRDPPPPSAPPASAAGDTHYHYHYPPGTTPSGGSQVDEPKAADRDTDKPADGGSGAGVWNVPPRNPGFTGRDDLLHELRARLMSGDRAVVQAMQGMGGVGKTSLAVEYAHRHTRDYQLVWWVNADQAPLIGEQLAALAVQAGWAVAGAPVTGAAARALARLRAGSGWLLVFDNVEDPDAVRPWLPHGTGHVIITSRRAGFTGIAATVQVDVFTRPESVAFLRDQVSTLTDADADRLAAGLGDLPLALAQAAGLLAETGMTAGEYLTELDRHAATVLGERAPAGYPAPLAGSVALAVDRLSRHDPAAVQLLRLCALLAPEPIPIAWWDRVPAGVLPEPLSALVGDRWALRHTLGRIAGLGLARIDTDTLQLHRLTQAVLRDQSHREGQNDRERAAQLMAANRPTVDVRDPASWPGWADLLPHLIHLDPVDGTETLLWPAIDAVYYLLLRGEHRTARDYSQAWYARWRDTLGPDHPGTLGMARNLGPALLMAGEFEQARQLDKDTLTRCRRVLGDDDPFTLTVAIDLALDLSELGEYEQARQLHEDTLTRCRRVLGDDHPYTLIAVENHADDLYKLGEHEQARQLHEDTLTRFRRVLGDEHHDTLMSATGLARALSALGEHEQARQLHEDTLTRCRRVLGDDHPDTLISATGLADDLRAVGEHEQARQLDEDTLTRRRRVLGDDHPDTLSSANNLAIDLRALGLIDEAESLEAYVREHRRPDKPPTPMP